MKLVKRFLAKVPSKLPQGIKEFDQWSNYILDTYEMPNNDSTKFALATAVMHAPATKGYVPKSYFGNILMKGAATQVAYQVMQDAKQRQAEKAELEKAEELAKTTEVTTDVVTDVTA